MLRNAIVLLAIGFVAANLPLNAEHQREVRNKRHLPIGLASNLLGGVKNGLNSIGQEVGHLAQLPVNIVKDILGCGQQSGGGQQGSDGIQRVLANTYSSLKTLVDDVKSGPSDQLEDKLTRFSTDLAKAKEVGDNALVGLYAQMDQAYSTEGQQGEQLRQQLNQGVEGARQNWHGLIDAMERGETVTKQKMQTASSKDKARLQKVVDQFEFGKSQLYEELRDSEVCFLGVL